MNEVDERKEIEAIKKRMAKYRKYESSKIAEMTDEEFHIYYKNQVESALEFAKEIGISNNNLKMNASKED